MYDLKNQTFVALAFATVNHIRDNSKEKCIHYLHREEIIEIAAVKIKCGRIERHFHSYVALDGIDSHNLDFDDCNFGAFHATPELLIGAPKFEDIIEKLYDFICDSIIIDIQFSSILQPLQLFKDKANSLGFIINSPTVSMWQVHKAKVLQARVDNTGKKFENLSLLQIAQMLNTDSSNWTDVFGEYEIYFNPENRGVFDLGRDDPLSWALAFAKLFIALVEDDNETMLESIDDGAPF